MSGLLEPEDTKDFGKQEYWDKNFKAKKGNFEWYVNYKDVLHLFSKKISKNSRILLTGCGSSTFGEKMYDNGYHSIVCVDYSEVVIETMRKRVGKRKGLTYEVMDVTNMTFEDESFDVIIDKACLDAIYAAEEDEYKLNAEKYFSEMKRVVVKDGYILTISLSQKYITSFLFDQLSSLTNYVYFVGETDDMHLTNPIFLYMTQKSGKTPGFSMNFSSMDGLFRPRMPSFIQKITVKGEFESFMHDTQAMFQSVNIMHTIQENQKEPIFQTVIKVEVADNCYHAYRFVVWDHPTSGKREAVSNVLVVPAGNEGNASFSTFEPIAQVIESLKSDRLIVIFRENKFKKEITDEVVKEDCKNLFRYFIPVGGKETLNIYTPPPTDTFRQVATGTLASGEKYVIEDREIEENSSKQSKEEPKSKRMSRRLVFTSNIRAIQSEVFYRVKGAKKKKKVFEFSRLSFFIHELMASSLLLCPPKDRQPSILVLGLGGGCLPNFLIHHFPEASITAVDIDAEVIKIAKEYFKLEDAIQTVEKDGLEFIKESPPALYDYIFVDIDEKDRNSAASFPPMSFLQKAFLIRMKETLKEGGVVVYNISSSDRSFFSACRRQFENVFKNLYTKATKDLNVAFVGTDREIIPIHQVESRRTEPIASYMVGFPFVEWTVC